MTDFIRTYPLQPIDTTWLDCKGDSIGIQPVNKAFASSSLMMSTQPSGKIEDVPEAWGDHPLNSALVFFSVIICLLALRNWFYISRNIFDCLIRWKGNEDLEENMQLVRTRNLIAIVLIIPFTLVAGRYGLYSPHYLESIGAGWNTLAVMGVFLSYLLLRTYLGWQFHPSKKGTDTYIEANRSARTFFIHTAVFVSAAAGIMSIFGANDLIIRKVLIYIIGAAYALFLIRKHQFLLSGCNPFTTFLYLCTLEILPTGILIATDLLL